MISEASLSAFPDTTNALRTPDRTNNHRPKPFVQWVGGKREMIANYPELIPAEFNTYHEPFLGGGAMLYHLQPTKAYLNDSNSELILAYQTLQVQVEEVIELLTLLKRKHSKELYLHIRQLDRTPEWEGASAAEKTTRLIYLNQTCFNGIYRVNRKGHFNTPIGSSLNKTIVDPDALRKTSEFLQGLVFQTGDFYELVKNVEPNDFVFLDPPYIPVSEHSNFTRYTKEQFTQEDQERVLKFFNEAHQQGARVLMTNSSAEKIFEMYEDYYIYLIDSSRNLNSKAVNRKPVKEVAVTNYPIPGLEAYNPKVIEEQ